MSEAWTQSQNHFQSLEAIDRLRDSLREEHGLMLQVCWHVFVQWLHGVMVISVFEQFPHCVPL